MTDGPSELRDEPPPAAAPGGPRALVLPVGADHYAVPLDRVALVAEAPVLTRVPGAPPAVLGVVNVRGEVVAVIDTGAALGVGALGSAPYAAVVEVPGGRVGLAAAGVPRAEALGRPLGPSALAAGLERRASGAAVVTLIDVAAAVAATQAGAT